MLAISRGMAAVVEARGGTHETADARERVIVELAPEH